MIMVSVTNYDMEESVAGGGCSDISCYFCMRFYSAHN